MTRPKQGVIRVRVAAQEARPKWMQKAMRDALESGNGAAASLRFGCRIAEDVNTAMAELTMDGVHYQSNPKARAQFGRNKDGLPYLTVGVIAENGKRYRLHWEGDAVPSKMCDIAVKHDAGKRVAACTVGLDVSRATVHELASPEQQRAYDAKPNRRALAAVRHARRAAGEVPAKRNYGRVAATD